MANVRHTKQSAKSLQKSNYKLIPSIFKRLSFYSYVCSSQAHLDAQRLNAWFCFYNQFRPFSDLLSERLIARRNF